MYYSDRFFTLFLIGQETEEALSAAKSKLVEMEKEDKPIRTPLCDKHPYYFPVER